MKITISLPDKLAAELDELAHMNGRSSRNRMIQKLLRDSIVREKQWRVAQRYVEGKKTLRQCAELLGVDLEGMINILQDLNIPLEVEDSPQHKLALKMLRQGRKSRQLQLSS
jgi:predicted HTH domain antitoxin